MWLHEHHLIYHDLWLWSAGARLSLSVTRSPYSVLTKILQQQKCSKDEGEEQQRNRLPLSHFLSRSATPSSVSHKCPAANSAEFRSASSSVQPAVVSMQKLTAAMMRVLMTRTKLEQICSVNICHSGSSGFYVISGQVVCKLTASGWKLKLFVMTWAHRGCWLPGLYFFTN